MAYTVSYANADPYTVSPINVRLGPAEAGYQLREFEPPVVVKRVDGRGRMQPVR